MGCCKLTHSWRFSMSMFPWEEGAPFVLPWDALGMISFLKKGSGEVPPGRQCCF